MQLHITHTTTALAVKLLFIKLQISVHVGIEFYITVSKKDKGLLLETKKKIW